mmetsp:Transcript_1163/g.1530  ORF Transcript_1163/g.1530 Transcript_1163/m.1530 type:complete len:233 (+) Transcript_1163:329-1027(+)
MYTAGVASHLIMDIKEGSEFVPNLFKASSLDARFRLVGISVHRIGYPQYALALALNGPNQTWEIFSQLISAHADNDGQTAWNILWVHGINNVNEFIRSALVGNLDSQWISNTTDKFQVRSIQLSCSFSYPQHVSRAIVKTTSGGIFSCQCLFVRQQKAFVSDKKISLSEGWGTGVDTNGLHETQRFIHLCSELAVIASFFGLFNKIQVPGLQTTDISISSSGKGTKNIQSLC